MNIAKDKQTGVYRVEMWTPHGRRKISTKQTSLAAAKKAVEDAGLAQIEAAARTGQLTGAAISRVLAGKKMSLEAIANEWLGYLQSIGRSGRTTDNYRLYINQFVEHVGDVHPSTITEKHIDAWINVDVSAEEHASTRKLRHTVVKQLFNFCAAKGWCVGNPAALVRVRGDLMRHEQKERHTRIPFTDKEVAKLLKATPAGDQWHTLVALGRYAGLRLGDAASLEWGCLSEPGAIVCWTDKRDRRVRVPIEDEPLQAALASLMPPESKKQTLIFPELAEIQASPTRRALLSVQFKRLCESVDIEGKSFHCLRHAYATEQIKAGKPLWYVSDTMGHRSEETTKRYVH